MIVLDRAFITFQFKKAQLLLGFLLLVITCSAPINQTSISGLTMGTTYNIKIVSSSSGKRKYIISSPLKLPSWSYISGCKTACV